MLEDAISLETNSGRMNRQQLEYRISIGGLKWVAKTALGAFLEVLPRKRDSSIQFQLGASDPNSPHILYLHSGWAIETVGRLWFTEQSHARVTFVRAGDPLLSAEFIDGFDYVWYGYSSLFQQHPCNAAKAILAVHDPAELFPEKADWKSLSTIPTKHLERLCSVGAVIVISREMQQMLESAGVGSLRIPTCSQIPLRDETRIQAVDQAALLSVGRIYRRKNFEQFIRLARRARKELGIRSYLKSDHFPLAEQDYHALLDRHSVYVCTSYQEGGPLPVMDAMRRGAVPVTSSVGQIPEIVDHGVNGFICSTDEEFYEAITKLAKDPDMLYSMRIAALRSIASVRNIDSIHRAARNVVGRIVASL